MLYALISSAFYAVQNIACKEYGRRFSSRARGLTLMLFFRDAGAVRGDGGGGRRGDDRGPADAAGGGVRAVL